MSRMLVQSVTVLLFVLLGPALNWADGRSSRCRSSQPTALRSSSSPSTTVSPDRIAFQPG